MKTGFWASLIVFVIAFGFMLAVNSIEFGIQIAFPEGIPEDRMNLAEMRKLVEALQKYNEAEGVISLISFGSGFIFFWLAKLKGIPLKN